MSSLAQHRALLEDLRAGRATFEHVAAVIRKVLIKRADRFYRTWSWSGQASIDVEDLVQEMLIAVWRAVDSWDGDRATLVRYVDAQVGRAASKRLRATAGYPDPRRREPARQSNGPTGFDPDLLIAEHLDAESAAIAHRRATNLLTWLGGIERHVVELVLKGNSLDEVTEVIYADSAARIDYRMDSVAHARQLVGLALRRATSEI